MKKKLFLLSAACCMWTASSCTDKTADTGSLKEGIYLLENSETAPYIYFSPQELTWRTGSGLAVSYAISGTYETDGSKIISKSGDDTAAEFKILSDDSVEVISVNMDISWLHAKERYSYYSFDPKERLFETICSADEALTLSKDGEAVVFEKMRCVCHQEVWDSFLKNVNSRIPCSVLTANYYELDREHVSEELYEQEKDSYPKLFFSLISYDGSRFEVRVRQSSEETEEKTETYLYLLHFTGKAPANALFAEYDYYVLADDPDVTWEQIENGMVSASSGDYIRHKMAYTNVTD